MSQSTTPDDLSEGDRYGLILQSLEDGVHMVDTSRRITYWNPGAERISGYLSQDMLGRCCHETMLSHCLASGNSFCLGNCPLAATMADGKSRSVDAFLKHRMGHRVPVSIRTAPVRDAGGTIIGGVEIFHTNALRYGQAPRFRGLERYGCLDPETGVANRDMTLLRLQHRLQDLHSFGIPLGLILLELNGRDEIVGHYGQEAWVRLLQAAAQTVAEALPPNGFLGRWDRDRFLSLLGNCDPAALEETAKRLTGLVGATEILWWGDSLRPAVSVRTTMPEAGDTPDAAVRHLSD